MSYLPKQILLKIERNYVNQINIFLYKLASIDFQAISPTQYIKFGIKETGNQMKYIYIPKNNRG